MVDIEPNKLLSIGEAAEYLGVSIDTLRRWEARGRIVPLRSPGGHRYFSKNDLDSLFNKKYTRDETSTTETKPIETEKSTTASVPDSPTVPLTQPISPIPPVPITPDTEIPIVPPVHHVEEIRPVEPNPPILIRESPPPSPITLDQRPLSILNPISQVMPAPSQNVFQKESSETPSLRLDTNNDKAKKSEVILIILIVFLTLADVVLFILWYSSTKITAPIP
ncbi:hypothetical protein A3A76_00225 [Candidatus Woesebacteria bacterium RIFCSPLOWO2_01_FULL_39_23]|uniref:HTH merR-type domain-containing protein n=1 Tax=Candidatus Woesebacteria bacterium RIFCSPHIGHO2_01_FULL_40_22 TaxID=1802499 RepID=A0A1F7YI99_9BACT|nr:MAG: hypothetical protein A2141_02915 [Candidatus Woesebacteria bacterium RBG_16_40_11]OGM26308.1 MAG: hypothetical protein A2628_03845 [Candidatus Woesebacteria bacterium RIFCSPHIGHO2_01_FULL_40_22]OGM38430.1 MAG: hypothetical protein A3E41_00185 [Candidatus Woesebacteria bacterium RIFCSPHIGHO2_12_FULL_38_9]OGM62863.1 MAG: hypothetical protein A3A76_00225 [Candidatus Woesebacteria bacterium RIFCSPLOWO2_01_FULL_39_23]